MVVFIGQTDHLMIPKTGFTKQNKKEEIYRICICGRMALLEGQEACSLCENKEVKMDGYLLRKVKKKNKLKKQWFSLLSKELYYYSNFDIFVCIGCNFWIFRE